MKQYVVAIAIDKVQTALYKAIFDHTQESQNNDKKLQQILHMSNIISVDFRKMINEQFQIMSEDEILCCSGVQIFSTRIQQEKLQEKLSTIFRNYYKMHSGNIFVKYVYIEKEISTDNDKLDIIHYVKKLLKSKACINKVIKDNQDILFQFQKKNEVNKNEFNCINNEKYSQFVLNINELRPKLVEKENTEKGFRIAVIKADLDGMGKLFQNIKHYKVYKEVSNILAEYICLEKINEMLKDRFKGLHLFPLYLAGDDIFFVVEVHDLIRGVSLCNALLKDINNTIKEKILTTKEEQIEKLSLSIGIDITYNTEPIRYYYERIEPQIKVAKDKKLNLKKEENKYVTYSKIALNKYVWFQMDFDNMYQSDKEKERRKELDVPNWSHFVHDVKLLEYGIGLKMEIRNHLYTLLSGLYEQDIRNDEIKFSNFFFYQLIPREVSDINSIAMKIEYMLIEKIISQVTITKEGKHYLQFSEEQRLQLLRYLESLLLFVDSRFGIKQEEKLNQQLLDSYEIKRIRTSVYNRPLRYIYNNNLNQKSHNKEGIQIRDLFAQNSVDEIIEEKELLHIEQIIEDGKKLKKSQGVIDKEVKRIENKLMKIYKTLPLSSTMLFRIKHLTQHMDQKQNVKVCSEMLEAVCNREGNSKNQNLLDNDGEKKNRLKFSKEMFENCASMWTPTYLDSLLVFYQLNESLIQYRRLNSCEEQKRKQGGKKNAKYES